MALARVGAQSAAALASGGTSALCCLPALRAVESNPALFERIRRAWGDEGPGPLQSSPAASPSRWALRWRGARGFVSVAEPRRDGDGEGGGSGDEVKRAPVTINENDFFEPKGFSSKIRADLARQSEMLGTTCALKAPDPPKEPTVEELHKMFLKVADATSAYDFVWSRKVLASAAGAHAIDVDASGVPEVEGFVHSIESLSAVDGPGLRYVLFTQGCAFRCMFCCNPDSWEFGAGTRMTSKDVARQIARAVPYIKFGGGGVTLSGGDPMLQPDFVSAVFQECHAMGLPTAIDTTGMGSRGHWRKVLPNTDLVMLCVKAPKPETYTKITGGFKQDVMLRFAAVAAQMSVPMWKRYVLVPGMTDSDFDVRWLAQFCKDHKNVEQIDVLPYHTLGVHKRAAMGLDYPLQGQRSPTRDEVLRFKGQLEAYIKELGVSVIATGIA